MGTNSDEAVVDAGDRRTGIDRRSMIKGAAIAGAAAWTAPVIIDSLTSPAAALSSGCWVYQYSVAAPLTGGTSCSWVTNSGVCSVSDADCASSAATTNLSKVGLNTPSCASVTNGGTQSLTFTVDSTCRIHAASVRSRNASVTYSCQTITVAAAGVTSLAVAPQSGNVWGTQSFVLLLIKCP